jgi:hypothetical protein
MADEWDKYAVESDEWEQYATTPKRQFNTIAEAQAAMQQARQGQQIAELNASPVGLAGQVLGGAANAITGGGMSKLEDMLAQRMNVPRFANKQNPAYNVGAGAGNLMVGAALAPVGGGLPGQIAAQAAGGAYSNPDNRLVGAAVSGGGTAALGLAGKAIGGMGDVIRKLPTRVSDNKAVAFAQKIRQAYTNTKTEAVKKFGNTLEDLAKNNPKKKIDLGNNSTIQDIVTDPDLSVEAKNVFNKTPILRDIISGKKTDVTVKEAQDIANYLQFKVPANIKSQHLDITDVINEVKAAQASAFPDEMATLRADYSRIAQPFKDLKSQMKLQNILGSIDKNFGGAVQRSQLKELFSDSPELLKEMGGYRNAGRLIKGAIGVGGFGVAALGGKKVLETIKGVQ